MPDTILLERLQLKFRKLPIEVEAFRMTKERRRDNSDWPEWLHKAWQKEYHEKGSVFCMSGGEQLFVMTLEGGQVPILFGSWIIRGIQGELYPCDHGVFLQTYEAV